MTTSIEDAGASTHGTGARVRALGHIVLYVSDLARSVRFYRDVLGWQAQPGAPGMPAVAFRASRDTHHDLLLIEVGNDAAPIPSGRRVGLYHFGVKVGDSDDELREIRDRLLAAADVCDLVGGTDHGVTHSLYVRDPDGNEVELYIDVPGKDWDAPDALAHMGPLAL